MLIDAILLAVCLTGVGWSVARDTGQYTAFKLLTDTASRQRCYRRWALESFLLLSGATLLCLTILGRLRALATLPAEFLPLHARVQAVVPKSQLSNSFLEGFGVALLVSLFVGTFGFGALMRKRKPLMIGDIQPLMPRNGAEMAHTALLSLNAGLSEEIFFRLLLPLLIVGLTQNLLLSFAAAAVIFGLVHAYQGAGGVVATMFMGFVFTALYLWTGNIWIAVALHAALDLFGLVVRPALMKIGEVNATA